MRDPPISFKHAKNTHIIIPQRYDTVQMSIIDPVLPSLAAASFAAADLTVLEGFAVASGAFESNLLAALELSSSEALVSGVAGLLHTVYCDKLFLRL